MIRRFWFAFVGLVLLCTLSGPSSATGPQASPPCKLVVLLYFDQLRGDYLERWHDLFGEGGFHRLENEGAWFQNCLYPYAATYTAVGHASVASGVVPRVHGIIANEWYDPAVAEQVYCVDSTRATQVPPAREDGKKRGKGSAAPERMQADTVGDWLKKATPQARVVSLSLKDRSAVLPAGKHPDACYWFNTSLGGFVTSTYYRDRLHPWVEEYNRTARADDWFATPWERLRPALDYVPRSGPEEAPGSGSGFLQGKSFPHRLDAGLSAPGRSSREAVLCSPFGNEILLGLVRRAVEAERLGQGEKADFLSVSFSSNDIVGHVWGPDSQEILDTTLRADIIVKDILAFLDRQVGRGRYAVVLTADHGVCPLPEASRVRGLPSGRLVMKPITDQAEAFLAQSFPLPANGSAPPKFVEEFLNNQYYLNKAVLKARHMEAPAVEKALADFLRNQPSIQAAYTRTQLLAASPPDDPIGRLVYASFNAERSGNVFVVARPYYLIDVLSGTHHGTPHPYDRKAPLLVLGPGVRSGPRKDPVSPLAAAAILSRCLGLNPPTPPVAPIPANLFSD